MGIIWINIFIFFIFSLLTIIVFKFSLFVILFLISSSLIICIIDFLFDIGIFFEIAKNYEDEGPFV